MAAASSPNVFGAVTKSDLSELRNAIQRNPACINQRNAVRPWSLVMVRRCSLVAGGSSQ